MEQAFRPAVWVKKNSALATEVMPSEPEAGFFPPLRRAEARLHPPYEHLIYEIAPSNISRLTSFFSELFWDTHRQLADKRNASEKRFGQRFHRRRQDTVCADISRSFGIHRKIVRHAQSHGNQS